MSAPDRPVLRVVSGFPTAEELAVVTAVVSAAAGPQAPDPTARVRRGGWNDPARLLGTAPLPGPNAWRSL